MNSGGDQVPVGFLLLAGFFTLGLAAVFIPILRNAMKDPTPKLDSDRKP